MSEKTFDICFTIVVIVYWLVVGYLIYTGKILN